MKFQRVFLIVLDSLGIGGAPDAERFGDLGADTLGHIDETVSHLNIPNLQKLGIGNLKPLTKVPPAETPLGYYRSLREHSNGKDTMTGHWEMMGLHTTKPFHYLHGHGFPKRADRGARSPHRQGNYREQSRLRNGNFGGDGRAGD